MRGPAWQPFRSCAALLAFTIVPWVLPASAQPADKQQCVASYESAQELRQAGKLRDARTQLLVCVQDACPEFVRAACGRWLDDVEAATPTVVFVARSPAGEDLSDVTVKIGDELLAEHLDGQAVPVDPGTQTFTFETSGRRPVHKSVLINEGEKNRSVTISFGEPATSRPAAMTASSQANAELQSPERPAGGMNRTLSYILAGVGAAGLAGFTILAVRGKSRENELRSSCAPSCEDADVDEVRTQYLIADASLGLGIASLAVAAYLFLSPPSSTNSSDASHVRVAVRPGTTGAFVSLASNF